MVLTGDHGTGLWSRGCDAYDVRGARAVLARPRKISTVGDADLTVCYGAGQTGTLPRPARVRAGFSLGGGDIRDIIRGEGGAG